MRCKRCFSYAINPHMNGRDKTDLDLCDVCYWRKRAELVPALENVVKYSEKMVRAYGTIYDDELKAYEELVGALSQIKEGKT